MRADRKKDCRGTGKACGGDGSLLIVWIIRVSAAPQEIQVEENVSLSRQGLRW